MSKLIITFLSTIYMLSGFPDLNFSPKVFTPKNLTVQLKDKKVYLYFNAYNPESQFLGYNIYYSSKSQTDIEQAHRKQLQKARIDEEIQKEYLIPNTDGMYPSIPVFDIHKKYNQNPKKEVIGFEYHLKYGPQFKSLNYPFYIGITALSGYKNTESTLSEILIVQP